MEINVERLKGTMDKAQNQPGVKHTSKMNEKQALSLHGVCLYIRISPWSRQKARQTMASLL